MSTVTHTVVRCLAGAARPWWRDPSWVQVIATVVAILLSSGVAIFVPWQERRTKRDAERASKLIAVSEPLSSAAGETSVAVLFSFHPERPWERYSLEVKVLKPAGARVIVQSGPNIAPKGRRGSAEMLRANFPTEAAERSAQAQLRDAPFDDLIENGLILARVRNETAAEDVLQRKFRIRATVKKPYD